MIKGWCGGGENWGCVTPQTEVGGGGSAVQLLPLHSNQPKCLCFTEKHLSCTVGGSGGVK